MRTVGTLALEGPRGEPVDLRRVLVSHGVATLAPNRVDERRRVLETTVEVDGVANTLRISQADVHVARVQASIDASSRKRNGRLLDAARHLLRLDEDLTPFYDKAATDPALSWVTTGAGRMLRSPKVFDDVVKTICTTNCSWSATVRMTNALVDHLGVVAAGGRRAFPSADAMAAAGPEFYQQVARAGYRGAYLQQLATRVAEGSLDLESLADPELPDDDVEERLLALPGVGPYAAAHIMLTALGRYRRLVLDSWTRPTYAKLAGRAATDAQIVRRFRRFGPYAGLAFWTLLTREWVEEP
jgi:3-methyladenine DNA glycosylase/8-oxoguanine DNA glycosylase